MGKRDERIYSEREIRRQERLQRLLNRFVGESEGVHITTFPTFYIILAVSLLGGLSSGLMWVFRQISREGVSAQTLMTAGDRFFIMGIVIAALCVLTFIVLKSRRLLLRIVGSLLIAMLAGLPLGIAVTACVEATNGLHVDENSTPERLHIRKIKVSELDEKGEDRQRLTFRTDDGKRYSFYHDGEMTTLWSLLQQDTACYVLLRRGIFGLPVIVGKE